MMLLIPVPWTQLVWALPFLTALCRPAEQDGLRRHKTRVDWVRQMVKQGRRWQPGRHLVLVVDGGLAVVSLALACVTQPVVMVSRLRWAAALYHPPEPHPPGKRGRKPTKGPRQRSVQGWAERTDTPWETVDVDWYGGKRKHLWVFTRPALWYSPKWPSVAIRFGLVGDPEGELRREAFFCTDLHTTPAQILQWVVMRWSVEVTCEEAWAHLGLETQRQWSDSAIARTTPVLLAVFAIVPGLALQLSQSGQIPVPITAWYHKAEPIFADCLASVRQHLWRARCLVHSTAAREFVPCPQDVFDLLLTGLP